MARKPSLFQQTAALIKIGEGLKGIRVQNEREKILLQRERLKLTKERQDTQKAFYSRQREQIRARKELMEARHLEQMLDLERQKIEAQIAESQERTASMRISNQLNSHKLSNLDPALAPGGTKVYQCPLCGTNHSVHAVNPNFLYCTNDGCNNAPLMLTTMNLN